MKKFTYLLIFVFTAFTSCKKDNNVQLRFTPILEDKTDMLGLNWDSIAYTTIWYSSGTELKTAEDRSDPNVYNHAINLDVRKDYLTLTAGDPCVVKKFDMIGKSGKILFYIPYEGEPGSNKITQKLPLSIPMSSSKSISIGVVRFKN
jgi:hypothetical protein